jgi:valyl-tRNA synthetase
VDPWVPNDLQSYLPQPDPQSLEVPLEDRWIFSRLNDCAEQANRAIEQYRFHEVAEVLYHFFWGEFCDWYVELKKLRFRDNSGLNSDWKNLLAAFEGALRLLHPVMPFLTEELWQRLAGSKVEPKRPEVERPVSISLCAYPQYNKAASDLAAEHDMSLLQDIITAARNLRADMKLDPKQRLDARLYTRARALEVAKAHTEAIQRLANVTMQIFEGTVPERAGAVRSSNEFDLVLQVPLEQAAGQLTRLEKERDQLEKVIASSRRQLNDGTFMSKAPAKIVDGIKVKLQDYEAQLEKVQASIAGLRE